MTLLDRAWSRYERLARPLFLPLALLVFTASGFAGLIYESIWTHYLKLFLGHAAYAQTLVLAIFMGGMAIGAWLASRLSPRWRNLLLAYAVVEALIGLASLAFHDVFIAATGFAFDRVIPSLGSPAAVHAFKWSLAAALILPQSVLLGMTFPLMTGGVLRIEPQRSGYAIAMLYFTNSLGAGVGVLASGFYYIPLVGLPGALAGAAVVNLAAAAAAALLPRAAPAPVQAPPAAAGRAASAPLSRLLLAVAALTGMSSFMYEIGWIRMLSLVLGSSTHAFELMLSAFILGLAFGGLWVRRRIDAAKDTVRLLALVQLAMGIAALATLPVYGATFHGMQWLIRVLAPSPAGYAMFNAASHGLALAVMFPAAFCAGMTLPLITATLLRLGAGERAIGQTYAVNTAGAIAGVLLAVHVGLPLLGVKGLIVAGAAVDLALGAVLLGAVPGPWRRVSVGAAASVATLVVAFVVFGVSLDAHRMASGVYRHGVLLDRSKHELLLHEDGKTATVSVTRSEDVRSLRTNGKPEAAVRMTGGRDTLGDEATMMFAAVLPLLLKPQARDAANIGFGSGITTHVLLTSPQLERVDTVEIEPAMVRGAALFRPHNARAFDDARSRIHYEDAKTFFASRQQRYDIIVSEPSNPWVSGVASLFSTEFYRDMRKYLREGGLLVQWVQLYEFSPVLLGSIIAALRPHFSDYVLWMPNDGDLIIVAANGGRVPEPDARALAFPQLAAAMKAFDLNNLHDVALRRLGGEEVFGPYFAAYGVPANSDFYPVLDVGAPLARFMRSTAVEVIQLPEAALPVLQLFEQRAALHPDPARLTPADATKGQSSRAMALRRAAATDEFLRYGRRSALARLPQGYAGQLILLRAALLECKLAADEVVRSALYQAARVALAQLPRAQAAALATRLAASPCTHRLAPADRQLLRLYAAVAGRLPKEMAAAAQAVLDSGAELPTDQTAYVVAALMAGRILTGQSSAALKVFAAHRSNLQRAGDWQGVFRLLVGQAESVRGTPPAAAVSS